MRLVIIFVLLLVLFQTATAQPEYAVYMPLVTTGKYYTLDCIDAYPFTIIYECGTVQP